MTKEDEKEEYIMKEYTVRQIVKLINFYSPSNSAQRIFYPGTDLQNYIRFAVMSSPLNYQRQMKIIQDGEAIFSFTIDPKNNNDFRYIDFSEKTLFKSLEHYINLDNDGPSFKIPDLFSDLCDKILEYANNENSESAINIKDSDIHFRSLRDTNNLYKIISCDLDPECPFHMNEKWFVYGIKLSSTTVLIHDKDLLYTDITTLPATIQYKTLLTGESIFDKYVLIRYHEPKTDKVYNAIGRVDERYSDDQIDPRLPLFEKIGNVNDTADHLSKIRCLGHTFYDDFSISDGTIIDYDIDYKSADGKEHIIRDYVAHFMFAREFPFETVLKYLKSRDDIDFSFELEQISSRKWTLTGRKIFKLVEIRKDEVK